MKTPQQINSNLDTFVSLYGFDPRQGEQGSEIWKKTKLGVISASNASKLVAKKDSDTRLNYMSELVAQICTGEFEEINSKYLDWGKHYESAARSSYEFDSDFKIQELPFVFLDDQFRVGCSPDGLVNDSRGVEIKCPYNAANYIKFLCEDKIKPEYQWQAQFSMFVLDCDTYDFCQYHPNMKRKPIKILSLKKDEKMQTTIKDSLQEFIKDMDLMLEKVGISFGSQWL